MLYTRDLYQSSFQNSRQLPYKKVDTRWVWAMNRDPKSEIWTCVGPCVFSTLIRDHENP